MAGRGTLGCGALGRSSGGLRQSITVGRSGAGRAVGALAIAGVFAVGVGVGMDRARTAGADSRRLGTAAEYNAVGETAGAGPLDEAERRIAASADRAPDAAALRSAAITAMLAQTGDRWASYLDPSQTLEERSLLAGNYVGLGVGLRRAADGRLLVDAVTPGSAAAGAHLRVGDEVVSVDGRSVGGRPAPDIVAELRGAAGSAVTVVLRDPARPSASSHADPAGRGARTVRLVRREVASPSLSTSWAAPGIGLVRLVTFTTGVGAQTRAAVARLRAEGATGLILDLRDNPGGLVDEAVAVAGVFLDGGSVVSYGGRTVARRTLLAPQGGDTTTPLAVLVDGGTASAAEIAAGALQDRKRAVLVGSRTFGKNSIQESFGLPNGSEIGLTVATYTTPAGHSLATVGLSPDVAVAASAPRSVSVARAAALVDGLATSGPAARR
ncbi:MAG: S41 family peptidase [Frankia sp.]